MDFLTTILATGLLVLPPMVESQYASYRLMRRPVVIAAGDGEEQADWSSVFQAWYDCEEASGTLLANDVSVCGAAGTDCDLGDNNTVARDGTNKIEGDQACDFTIASSEYYRCDRGATPGCGALDGTGDATVVAWARFDDDAGDARIWQNGGSPGWRLNRITATDKLRCRFQGKSANSANNTFLINTWYHAACIFTDAADDLSTYINAANDGSNNPTTLTADTNDPTFGATDNTTASTFWGGQLDESGFARVAFTVAELARVCACGISQATARCMCDATTPANYKTCTDDTDCQVLGNTTAICSSNGVCDGLRPGSNPGCGNVTLTACDAAVPS